MARVFVPCGRPTTLNAERRGNRWKRAEQTRTDRLLGRSAGQRLHARRYMFPDPAHIVSWPVYTSRRSWPDVGAWQPALKAVVDGLVDAGAWPDDNHDHIPAITYKAPQLGGINGLWVYIIPLPALEEHVWSGA